MASENVTQHTDRDEARRLFAAVAMRAVFLITVGAGILVVLGNGAYGTAFVVAELVAVVLAVVVMLRRQGSAFIRIRAVAAFLGWATFLAVYFACFPSLWQAALAQGGENGLDVLFSLMCLVASLPLVVVALVLALRGWTWAAHDRAARRRQ